jgi:hypothetical protein
MVPLIPFTFYRGRTVSYLFVPVLGVFNQPKGHGDFLMSEIQFYDTGYKIVNNEFRAYPLDEIIFTILILAVSRTFFVMLRYK